MGSRISRKMRRADAHDIGQARRLRQAATSAEQLLWQLLRDRWLAHYKFRRQHPLGPYCADFYCAQCALVVELDGASHEGREAHDARRKQWLEERGLRVIRFANSELDSNPSAVLATILAACRAAARPSPPVPLSPNGVWGEGE